MPITSKLVSGLGLLCVVIILALGASIFSLQAITEQAGLAVAQSSTKWNNVKDAGTATDALTSGLTAGGLYLFNGSTWDRVRGDTTNGIDVDVTKANVCRTTAVEPTNVEGTFNPCSQNLVGGQRVTIGNGGYVGSNGQTWASSPTQASVKFNTQTTGAADTAVVVTIAAGASGTRNMLERLDARCSAGTAGLTVVDGATTIWSSLAAEVTATRFSTNWNPPLAASNATALVITLTTCGAANTGTLTVQADRQ